MAQTRVGLSELLAEATSSLRKVSRASRHERARIASDLTRLGVWSRDSARPRGSLGASAKDRAVEAEATSTLIEWLDDSNEEVRSSAALALAEWGGSGSAAAIAQRLPKESSDEVALNYLTALRTIGGDAATSALLAYVEHGNARVRDAALSAVLELATGGASEESEAPSQEAVQARLTDDVSAGSSGPGLLLKSLARLAHDESATEYQRQRATDALHELSYVLSHPAKPSPPDDGPLGEADTDLRPPRHVSEQSAIKDARTTIGILSSSEPKRWTRKPKREVFAFDPSQPIFFVLPSIPTHVGAATSARRLVAQEDVFAMKAIAQALSTLTPRLEIDVRAAHWLEGDRVENLILLCSKRRNHITERVLENEGVRANLKCDFVRRGDRWAIQYFDEHFESPSYDQEMELMATGGDPEEGPLEDRALLARLPNPWNPSAKIFLVAGIRACGTLGAGEFLRDRLGEIRELTGGQDFALLLHVTYKGWSSQADILRDRVL